MALHQTTDATFSKDILESATPVLVDFWAEWCGPCRMLLPILEEIATEVADKIKIVKVNIDENPTIPAKYGVRSVPTLILFKNGEATASKAGLHSKNTIVSWIESNI